MFAGSCVDSESVTFETAESSHSTKVQYRNYFDVYELRRSYGARVNFRLSEVREADILCEVSEANEHKE